MKLSAVGLLAFAVLWATIAGHGQAADGPEWKEVASFKMPTAPTMVFISGDQRFVFAQHELKTKFDKGGIAPGIFVSRLLRCYAVDSGKELLVVDKDQKVARLRELTSAQANVLALADDTDTVHIYDPFLGQEIAVLDVTSPTDMPPNVTRKINGDVRLGDVLFTSAGKTLITVRNEQRWQKDITAPGGFVGAGYQQVAFWDVETKKKTETLDLDDKEARRGQLTLLPASNALLVRFSNGVRMADLAKRQWATIFPVKEPTAATPSRDEKRVAITDRAQNIKVFEVTTGKELVSFQEKPISKKLLRDKNDKPIPGVYEEGPIAEFVDEDKVLRLTLNDGKTVVYRDATTGKEVKKPASETFTFPGNPRVLAVSADRRLAVTAAPGSGNCTIWRRTQ